MSQTIQAQDTVALLGTGTMGHGMAASALRAGIPTIVWDRSPARSRDLAAFGAQVVCQLWRDAERNLDVFRSKVEQWFDDTMARAAGLAGMVLTSGNP